MCKSVIVMVVLLYAFMVQVAFGQVQVKNSAIERAIIFRPNQDAIRGKLVEIGEEYVVVLTPERETRVPFADISRMILAVDRGSAQGPVTGGALAGYASMCLLARSQDNGGFVESRDASWYLLIVAPSVALGAGIGYLIEGGSAREEEVFDFRGDDKAKAVERSRLMRAATGTLRESKVHVTFQGSHVQSRLPKFTLPGSVSYDYDTRIGKFNWLRKVQATYSLVPQAEVGVALVWFNEPPQSGFGYESLANFDSKSYLGSQSFEAIGKYVVALYEPLHGLLDLPIDIKLGGGFGVASIDYSRTITVLSYTQGGSGGQQFSTFAVSDNFVTGYIFGQIEVELVDGFSMGLVADKVLGPSRAARAVPEAGIPAQTLRFDNSSIGFAISLHF